MVYMDMFFAVARYFFDTNEDGTLVRDEEGCEMNGPQAARVEAIAILPQLAKDLKTDGNRYTLAVTVRDVTSKPVFQAKLSFNCAWLE